MFLLHIILHQPISTSVAGLVYKYLDKSLIYIAVTPNLVHMSSVCKLRLENVTTFSGWDSWIFEKGGLVFPCHCCFGNTSWKYEPPILSQWMCDSPEYSLMLNINAWLRWSIGGWATKGLYYKCVLSQGLLLSQVKGQVKTCSVFCIEATAKRQRLDECWIVVISESIQSHVTKCS